MGKVRHVIIGNSAAGLNAARAIRSVDTDCKVSILSAEKCFAYSPVILPYLLSGRIKKRQMYLTDDAFYRRNSLELLLNQKVEGIDTKQQKIFIHDGSVVEYDTLLIASGASARKLKIAAGSNQKIFTLRTINDAKKILKASKKANHILMVGAGLVGLETSYALEKKGKKITILARSNQVLSRNSDVECAKIIQQDIEQRGIRFLLGRDVVGITSAKDTLAKNRMHVTTDQNDKLIADLIVVGKGVDPNIQFLNGSEIKCDEGILVNLRMQTNISNVHAAGDCAQARNLLTGKYEIFGSWPSACLEGKIAGLNMADRETNLAGEIAYNILPVFNRTAAFAEKKDADDAQTEVFMCNDKKRGTYRKIVVKKNKIVGAVLLGKYQDAGIILNLITKRTDISKIKESLAMNPILWGGIINKQP
jgi:NAD(P)H-nitrite reductase large subunit